MKAEQLFPGLRAGLLAAALLAGGPALAQDSAAPLSLPELVKRALALAPPQRIAEASVGLAQAQRDSTRSGLLPQLGAGVQQTRQTTNPATLGFEFPGLPSLIGPYSVFDARLKLSQTVLDFARHSELAGAGYAVDAARAEAAQSRERIATEVALNYIQVLAGEQAVDAARSDLALAEDLLILARDQRQAGVASGVDVARAQTAVAQDRYALSEAETGIARSRLQLQRATVLPMDAPLQLGGRLDGVDGAALTAGQALEVARASRAELAAIDATLKQADAEVHAAQRRSWPTLSLFADYGQSSSTPVRSEEDTYRYGASLELPIYSGGALRAGEDAARLRLEQQRAQAEDLRRQVEQDVRLALVTVDNTAEQVKAAVSARDLANRELQLARDRFLNGVANNVDVVSAQASLARARSQYIAALAAHQQARVNLAAAQGRAHEFAL
ncbi:TolC family protein [Solimonas sp. K1W22B-7]|uniref:TolC family protein n=1 Tax=Solimonas sp. K1W22B-7 TaxID=2303331 RepID=UPI000E331222|nr:TolC family protein [Solimonas sp. K1W22B-7]AXQ29970.1 TolC family protein [Solimonas sp. K1W22B-7]